MLGGQPVTANAAALAVVVTAVFTLTLLCFSLRDFSRSRLEQFCEQRRRSARFGEILLNHRKALLLCEVLLLILIVGAVWGAVKSGTFVVFQFPVGGTWYVIAGWILRMVALFVSAGFLFVVLPWTIARVRGEVLLCRIWPWLSPGSRLFTPCWQFAMQLDRLVHRMFGVPEPESETAGNLLTEELLTVVDESRRQGVIQSNASKMIHRVVDLHTEDVAAIMTPRTDMVTTDADTPLRTAQRQLLENGFSRVPVIGDGIDDIVGILYARDLLAYSSESDQTDDSMTAADLVREVLYAPESQGIGDLLEAMRQKKVHMAIIVDEYSGVSGLVTLEDILEEIVGEISDEYDSEDGTLWKEQSDGRTDVDARYHLDDLNEEFGYGFPEDEEFDTIGGFVLSCFGRIPVAGEEHFWHNLKLTVLDADERHLIRVRIEGDASAVQPEHNSSASAS